jgi:hypothetical protein
MRTGLGPGGGRGRRGGRRGGRNGGRSRDDSFGDDGGDDSRNDVEADAEMDEAGLNRKRGAAQTETLAGSGVAKTVLMLEGGTNPQNTSVPLSPSSKHEPKRNRPSPSSNDTNNGKNSSNDKLSKALLVGLHAGSRLAQ